MGITNEVMEAVWNSYRDLGNIDWDAALNPDSDNWEERCRVARAFVEPNGLSDEQMDQYAEYTEDTWLSGKWVQEILMNFDFDHSDKIKKVLDHVIKKGY
jgi:hypothetical protein